MEHKDEEYTGSDREHPSTLTRKSKEDDAQKKEHHGVEQILQSTRPYGPFQIVLTVVMCTLEMPGAMAIYLTYFIAKEAPWMCTTNSTECTSNITHTENDVSRCSMNRSEWRFVDAPNTSLQAYFDLSCSQEWELYVLGSSIFLGWGLSSIFVSHLANKYGRKKVIFASLFAVVLFGFVTIFSPRVEIFIVLRMLLGFGLPGLFHIVFTLAGEFTVNAYRPLALNIIQSSGTLSVCLFCLMAYFISDWKLLTILTTLPCLLGFFFIPFVPESMHWLHTNGHDKEANAVVQRICYWNKMPVPDNVQIATAAQDQEEKPKTIGFFSLFTNNTLSKRTCKLFYSWFVIGLLYYSISLAAQDLTGSFHRDFVLLQLVQIPSNLIAGYSCDRFGRKKTIASNVALASVTCLLIAVVPIRKGSIVSSHIGESAVAAIRLGLGILGSFTLNMSFSSFSSWTMELYGTDLRALVMGASNLMVRVGGATSPWIVNALKRVNTMTPFLVMGSFGLTCSWAMFTLPETKNVALSDKTGRIERGSDCVHDTKVIIENTVVDDPK